MLSSLTFQKVNMRLTPCYALSRSLMLSQTLRERERREKLGEREKLKQSKQVKTRLPISIPFMPAYATFIYFLYFLFVEILI